MIIIGRNGLFVRSKSLAVFRNIANAVKCESRFRVESFSTKASNQGGEQSGNLESASTASSQPTSSDFSIGDVLNMNVDEKDVSRHEAVTDWWDLNGLMMGLHAMNDLRISLIRNGLENTGRLKGEDIKTDPNYLKGVKIIEAGCGAGILCEPLARLGAEVTGIDPSQELIIAARSHASSNAHTLKTVPTYINTTIEDHSSNNPNTYDAIIASEVIEHVPNKHVFLEACIKSLKPGGSIFLTTPNRTTVSWMGSIILAENVFRIIPKGLHDWNQFITPTELKQLLGKSCCKTILVNGMVYNPFTNSWSWSSPTMLHYAIHATKKC